MFRSVQKLLPAAMLMGALGAVAPIATAQAATNNNSPFKMLLGFDFITRPPVSGTMALPAFIGPFISSASVNADRFNDGLANSPAIIFNNLSGAVTLTVTLSADVPSSRMDYGTAANHNYYGDLSYFVTVTVDGNVVQKLVEDNTTGGGWYSVKLPYLSAGTHNIVWKVSSNRRNVPINSVGDFFCVTEMAIMTP